MLQTKPCHAKEMLRSMYNEDILAYKPSPATSDRRVLSEVLNKQTLDVKEIYDTVQQYKIPYGWLVIVTHAKETELKIIPRLFAMMTLEKRIYFCYRT
jgi:hypothetical protein